MKIKNLLLKFNQVILNILCILVISSWSNLYSQEVSGNLKNHANQEIKLLGYSGFQTIELAKSTLDENGNFEITYKDYTGMGYIETSDQSKLFLVLNEPKISINGSHLQDTENINFINSPENLLFSQYAVEHTQREKALAGWKYLLPQYKNNDLLNIEKDFSKIIEKEIERIEKEDREFLKNIEQSYYVSTFLPLRKLIDDIPLSVKQYPNRIPNNIAYLRNINFNDSKLYNSGIIDDLIESHYWLIENSGLSADSMYSEMNASTDKIIQSIIENEKLLNEVGDFLFNFLEKRSLFKASEYLSIKILNQTSCTIDDDLAKHMETYRVMKVGNTAEDIEFQGKKMMMGTEINKELKFSDLSSNYTLVVFGASWCSTCANEIPKIKDKYIPWKLKGVETVFISLDHDESEYTNFVKDFPFLSSCDFKGWDNKAVKDYYVFAAPTLYLLNKERKIILRPSSIEQVDAWVNYKLDSNN